MKEVSSLPEIWDVYDENRVKKPYTHVRGVPLDEGDWHLVVETWVVTQDNRVLLTLRDPNKHYGNLWECTGGSALSGEDSITAIHRELREETGLGMGNVQPTLLCTTLHHNSIVDTYAIRLNFTLSDLVLQPGETVDAKFVDFSALEDSSCESWLAEPIAYCAPRCRCSSASSRGRNAPICIRWTDIRWVTAVCGSVTALHRSFRAKPAWCRCCS